MILTYVDQCMMAESSLERVQLDVCVESLCQHFVVLVTVIGHNLVGFMVPTTFGIRVVTRSHSRVGHLSTEVIEEACSLIDGP